MQYHDRRHSTYMPIFIPHIKNKKISHDDHYMVPDKKLKSKSKIYNDLLKIIEEVDSENYFVPDLKVYNRVNRALFLCVDRNTLLGMVMVIQSFFTFNDPRCYIVNLLVAGDVFITVKSILHKYFSKMNYRIQSFDKSNLEAIKPFIESSCTDNPHCKNEMNFARFFYQNYFSEPLYLYVDTDILIFSNVDVFFENLSNETITVVKNFPIVLTAQFTSPTAKSNVLSKHNIKGEMELSFNAGIYSVNNEEFVRNNHLNGLIQFMCEETESFRFGTQPVLNIYFFHIATSVPIKAIFCNKNHIYYSDWNYTWHTAVNDTIHCFSKIKSLHFSGDCKPWNETSPYFSLFNKVINSIKDQEQDIQVYLPSHCQGYNSILYTKQLLALTDRSVPVANSNMFKEHDVLVYRFGRDFGNGQFVNSSKVSQQCSKHIADLEKNNITCYPSATLMTIYENKPTLLQLFTDKGIKIPESLFVLQTDDDIHLKVLHNMAYPLLIKACYSCSSNFIAQVDTADELDQKCRLFFQSNPNQPLLLQRKIKFTKEARLTYVGTHVYHGYYRIKENANIVSGATNFGSVVSFDIDLPSFKPFITNFIAKTNIYMGGIDIAWENDNFDTEPFVFEVSPIFDLNPPPTDVYKALPYQEFKKSKEYTLAHIEIYKRSADCLLQFIKDIHQRRKLYCDIDCTLSDSAPRIRKYFANDGYKEYINVIEDLPIENAVATINKLYDKYEVILITARKSYDDYMNVTRNWLNKWNIKYHKIIYTSTAAEKLQHVPLLQHPTAVFIDDFTINHHSICKVDTDTYQTFVNTGMTIYRFDNDTITWNYIHDQLI